MPISWPSRWLPYTAWRLPLMNTLKLTLLSVAILLVPEISLATTINFDQVVAPSFYSDVVPSPSEGPTLVYPEVTFTGGVIQSNFGSGSTPSPNVYATEPLGILHD